MATPGAHSKYVTWSRARRLEAAVLRVLNEDWAQTEAADTYGVSRQSVNKHVGVERRKQAELEEKQAELAQRVTDAAKGPLGLPEERRVGSFEEFDERYFGRWICPDCEVHHPTPEFHRSISEVLEDADLKRVVINMPPYHAKVLSLDTPIPTPTGWTLIEGLRPGDEVFDRLGKVCRVVALSELKECRRRVVLGDNSEFLTDDDHRWWVEPRDTKKVGFVTTAEVAAAPHARRFRIPLAGPLDLPEVELPIDPYVLGAWLGDGHSAGARISSHQDDQPFMRAQFEAAGFTTTGQSHPQVFGVLGLQGLLRSLGLRNFKHVPDVYLRASAAQRLALLQGLMDTDGTVLTPDAGAAASFTNMNESLADSVFELAASLGQKPRRYKGDAKLNGVVTGVAYHVTFSPTRAHSPFRMARKTEKLPEVRSRVSTRPFKRVETLDRSVVGRCIAVDSPTQTFLAGEAMVPTGNSTLVTVKNTVYKLVKNPNHRRIIMSKSLPFARTFLHSVDQLLTNPDLYDDGPNLIADWGPFKSEAKNSVWSKEQIYVTGRVTAEKDPSVQVLGVNGQIYGRRADDIVADDIADIDNQTNPARVAQMLTWLDKEALSRVGRNGRMIFVGTRVHPGDIYSFIVKRPTYKVLQFPCILDDTLEQTLWEEHFPYEAAVVRREEMKPAEWQLVYQNVDVPGLGASWNEEMIEQCKDTSRVIGMFDPDWRLVMGLDLAGGSKDSGYTAGVVKGVDLRTGKRFYVDSFNEKSMKAPRLRDQILEFADMYPLYELRVEVNGLQSQIIQYNEELVQALALKGIRVVPHTTHKNKWDAEFGVESMAPLWGASMVSVPWGSAPSARKMQALLEQLLLFPMGMQSDLVMADWFADLGCRDLLKRAHLPLFSERMHVPDRIRQRRRIVDFGSREIRRVPIADQRGPASQMDRVSTLRRRTIGRPMQHGEELPAPPPTTQFVNVAGDVEDNERIPA